MADKIIEETLSKQEKFAIIRNSKIERVLRYANVYAIQDIANASPELLEALFGKRGAYMHKLTISEMETIGGVKSVMHKKFDI